MNSSNKKKDFSYQGIGLRISLYSVIISFLFSLISISILVYFESKKNHKAIFNNAHRSIRTIEQQLAKRLWDIDTDRVLITLNSLEKLPFINGVYLVDYLGGDFSIGKLSDKEDIAYPIIYENDVLATIKIYLNNNEIKESLYSKYKVMALNIILVIGLMGLIFYIMINQLLIKHISYISRFKKNSESRSKEEYIPISLKRKPRNDELSYLVDVLNEGKQSAVALCKAKKESQEQMEYQANFDLLTGLPNRRNLYDHLNHQIKQYHPSYGHLVIMFIDLDGFKQVNDSMGHAAGDKVLKECANRLQNITDTLNGYLFRLGGDEFILCFYDKYDEGVEDQAKQVIAVFDSKIHTHGIHVKLGCSIGIALYPNGFFDEPKQLIRNADSALYKAKDLGRNTFFSFNDEIRKDIIYEAKVKDSLLGAIENNLFEIYYQPLINIQQNTIIGFESLLRWYDSDLGWIPPDIFIPIAEKMGIIFDIDIWVFEKALQQVDIWRKQFGEDFIVSVNFSPTNFYHGNFSEWVNNSIMLKERSYDWVELEITERLVLNNDSIVLSGIDSLRKKGVQFGIDDFGIGYSSLSYIKKFSNILSKIKIDRMFIDEILEENFDVAFVKSIVMMSESLGLTVLAEGVEKEGQINLLKELGCELVQGYYFSKPLPCSEIEEFIKVWSIAYCELPLLYPAHSTLNLSDSSDSKGSSDSNNPSSY